MLKRLNKVKIAVSAILTAVLLCASTLTAGAVTATASATKEDFDAVNALQKEFYTETYVPCYNSYLQALRDFRTQIHNTNFETKEQAQRVLDFLNELRVRHVDFYGTRKTAGKSRYDVPAARVAMYKAADEDKDYASAIQYCYTLRTLVEARVNLLSDLKSKIENYIILGTDTPAISASLTVTGIVNEKYHEYQKYNNFTIVITNNTDHPITDWTLAFDYICGDAENLWVDNYNWIPYICTGNVWVENGVYMSIQTIKISTINTHDTAFVIPAHGSLTIYGRGGDSLGSDGLRGYGIGTGVENIKLNGVSIPMSFSNLVSL